MLRAPKVNAITTRIGTWRSLVAHLHGVQGVGGSNPLVPTIFESRVSMARSKKKAKSAARPGLWKRPKGKAPAPVKKPLTSILPGFVERLIPKLPNMSFAQLIGMWRNAILKQDDPKWRLESEKMLKALGREWKRRHIDAMRTGDFFTWPTTDAPGYTGEASLSGAPPEGMLSFMGYRVGRIADLSDATRRHALVAIFSKELPPVVSAAYMHQWAAPESAARLRKMAETIAALTRNAKRRDTIHLDDAIKEWESDLEFLHDEYYCGKFNFSWPLTRN